jgi:acid phosphatase
MAGRTWRLRAWLWVAVCTVTVMAAAACSAGSGSGTASSGTASPSIVPGPASAAPGGYSKVLVVMEENRDYKEIIGSSEAPYINRLATEFGTATAYDAGYPAKCPSLAAYLLLTSGSDHGICDNAGPDVHPLACSARLWPRDGSGGSPAA